MVETTKTKKQFTTMVIITLVVIIIMLVVSWGIYQENQKLLQRKTTLAGLSNDLTVLDDILFSRSKYQPKVIQAIKTLPDGFDEISFSMSQIEKQATDSAQQLETTIEKVTVEKKETTAIAITSKTGGTFGSLTSFLNRLAKLPYHTRITDLEIEKGESAVSATIKYLLYIK